MGMSEKCRCSYGGITRTIMQEKEALFTVAARQINGLSHGGEFYVSSVQFWMDIFKTMRDDGYFTGSFLDRNLIQFCFLNLIQDELDKDVRTWNSHLIRTRPAHGTPGGRPILMFSMPQLYAAEDKLQPVLEEDIAVCREECTPKGQYPCDETVFELCILLMDENAWEAPTDAYAAAELYSLLRNEILGNL